MVSYYFGNKAGLIAAILDAIIHDECAGIAQEIGSADGPERLHRAIVGIARTTAEPGFYRGFFDIFPHAARDPELRKRLVTLYQWYSEVELGWLGLEIGGDPGRERRLRALAQLVAAAIDGLGIQARIDPEHFDTAGAFDVLELLLRNSWAEFASPRD